MKNTETFVSKTDQDLKNFSFLSLVKVKIDRMSLKKLR